MKDRNLGFFPIYTARFSGNCLFRRKFFVWVRNTDLLNLPTVTIPVIIVSALSLTKPWICFNFWMDGPHARGVRPGWMKVWCTYCPRQNDVYFGNKTLLKAVQGNIYCECLMRKIVCKRSFGILCMYVFENIKLRSAFHWDSTNGKWATGSLINLQ